MVLDREYNWRFPLRDYAIHERMQPAEGCVNLQYTFGLLFLDRRTVKQQCTLAHRSTARRCEADTPGRSAFTSHTTDARDTHRPASKMLRMIMTGAFATHYALFH